MSINMINEDDIHYNVIINNTLGIQTNNPKYPLDVNGDMNTSGLLYVNGQGDQRISLGLGVSGAELKFNDTGKAHFSFSNFNHRLYIGDSSVSGTHGTAISAAITIEKKQLGLDVGIGITDPSYQLDVAGDINGDTSYKLLGNDVISLDGSNNTIGTFTSQLNINSTIGALLLPRMTNVQRNLITAEDGMVIYSTTDAKIQGRQGGVWVNLA